MARALYALLALLLLILVFGGALWYFAYGYGEAPPRRAAVSGLSDRVTIAWDDRGPATIRADSLTDRYAGLGYVHGTRRAWTAVLWRQTATGRLGEWFGRETLPIDRLTRRLGLTDLARQAYARLSSRDQALLNAYTAGMNAALKSSSVQNRSEFVLLNITPAPWKPWHTLALERLYAYLAAQPPPLDSLPSRATQARAFLQANRRLRHWLHLHDFDHSAAWSVQDTTATYLFQRHVFGSSALPLFQAVRLLSPDRPPTLAASLPGTPLMPAGRNGSRAWSFLPAGTLRLVRAPYDSTRMRSTHERILDAEGNEYLLDIHRSETALLLGDPSAASSKQRAVPTIPPADTSRMADTTRAADTSSTAPLRSVAFQPTAPQEQADVPGRAAGQQEPQRVPALTEATPLDSARTGSPWQVQWAGFEPVSDLAQWRALSQGRTPSFRLFGGGGLTMDSSGTTQVFGQPTHTIRFPGSLVIGNDDWTPALADQIQAMLQTRRHVEPSTWIKADSSAWASRLLPTMLASIDSLSRTRSGTFTYQERTDVFGQSVTYLRNWDFSYDRASIGASIFDTWIHAYRKAAGQLPTPEITDTLARREHRRRFRALDQAVMSLSRRFGERLEQWRWENVAPDKRYFPAWTDSLATGRRRKMAQTRYAPLSLPGSGHLSTLRWGASPLSKGLPAPAAYELWIGTSQWERLYLRRRRFETGSVLGRYRTPRRAPEAIVLSTDSTAVRTTTLVPDVPSEPIRLFGTE